MATPHERKIVLLGKEGVGKSTMIYRIRFGSFEGAREATIGAAFMSYKIIDEQGNIIPLHFWDTAGNERFTRLLPMYIRGALVVLVCFSDYSDLQTISKYVEDVWRVEPMAKIILVGTKVDLFSQEGSVWRDLLEVNLETIPCKELREYASSKGFPLFFTSSRTGQGVKNLVNHVSSLVSDSPKTQEERVILQSPESWAPKCCS